MADHALIIDGQAVTSDTTFPVIDPSTGEAFAECPDCSRAQLEDAMNAAQAAFRGWAADEGARRKALLACAAALTPRAQEIGTLLTREQGKPLKDAITEVHGAAFWLQHTAGLELPVESLHEDDTTRIIWEIDFKNKTASPVEFCTGRDQTTRGQGTPATGLSVKW